MMTTNARNVRNKRKIKTRRNKVKRRKITARRVHRITKTSEFLKIAQRTCEYLQKIKLIKEILQEKYKKPILIEQHFCTLFFNCSKEKQKAVEKKKVRYPPVQKIRNHLARALQNVSSISSSINPFKSAGSRMGGAIQGAASGLQNAVLNQVDSLLSIKDNGLFNKGGNTDTNTGCSIVEGWSCPRQGKYAHPIDCQKYVQCTKNGVFSKELSNTVYECADDEAYDPNIRSCTTDWSSCEALEQCLYNRQLIEDPSDDNSYFICISSGKIKETFDLYRRDCTPGRVFDPDYQLCLDSDSYKKLASAKKKRQQEKRRRECEKKKAQKKKKKKSKSKRKSAQKKTKHTVYKASNQRKS